MVRGVTFDKQLMTSQDFAHQTNYFYQGKHGITKGCTVVKDANGKLVVSDGYFMVYGRLIANIGNTIITPPTVASGTLYSKLVFTINLALANTVEAFNQGYFEIISSASAYPTLTQENLDTGGQKFQLEFCKFENVVAGVTNLVDTRTVLSMTAVNADTVDGLHAADFIQFKKRSLTVAELNNSNYPQPYVASIEAGTSQAIGLPTAWFHISYFRHTDNNGYGTQVAVGLDAGNVMFMRTSTGTNWNGWRRVTPQYGTTIPTTLAEGDVYLVYE